MRVPLVRWSRPPECRRELFAQAQLSLQVCKQLWLLSRQVAFWDALVPPVAVRDLDQSSVQFQSQYERAATRSTTTQFPTVSEATTFRRFGRFRFGSHDGFFVWQLLFRASHHSRDGSRKQRTRGLETSVVARLSMSKATGSKRESRLRNGAGKIGFHAANGR